MTLGIVWERRVSGVEELIVVSDSRLSSGIAPYWDTNPKIVLLPRTDAVISFAGDTDSAYPLIQQAINIIYMHDPAMRRVMDLCDFKGHLLRVFSDVVKHVGDLKSWGRSQPDLSSRFLLSGYSWKYGRFYCWELGYSPHSKTYVERRAGGGKRKGGIVRMQRCVGDERLVKIALERIGRLLKSRGKAHSDPLDMEPFEVLRDMIRENKDFPEIGGAPQMVKIYKHMNTVPVGIRWPDRSSGVDWVMGRPLMHYELNRWSTIDPDTLQRIE